MIDAYVRFVAFVSRLCGIAAGGMIAASVVVVCQMVFVRYVLRESVIWQTEFVTYLLIAATIVGSPYVLLTKGHVNVDLLPMYLGHRGRYALALVSAIISLAFCVIAAWTGYREWYLAWDNDWLSDSLWGVRLWIPYATLPIGFGILALQYVADIIGLLTGREMPFGIAQERVR